jgi:hypothetical protein
MKKYIVTSEYGIFSDEFTIINICVVDTVEEADKIAENLNKCGKTFKSLCEKYLKSFSLKTIQDKEDLLSFLKKEGAKNKIKYYELLLCFCDDLSVFRSINFSVEQVTYLAKA